jgi:outer membrane receptor protein involved in Fe transport
VTGGVRVFNQTLQETQGTGLLFVGPSDVAFTSTSKSNTSALGKADVSYKISPTMTTYFNWSQGFRRGELNALPKYTPYQNFTTPAAAFSAQPDTVDNFEGGLKGVFHKITYDASVYDIEWHNIQANIPSTPIVLPAVLNVGDGYSRGLDLALSGYLTEHIFGQVNYSLNESKLTSISQVAVEAATSLFVGGGRFPGVPEHQLNWRFEYQQRLSDTIQMRYGVDGNYRTSSSSTISANSAKVSGFDMWDLYIGASYKDWTARLYVNNLNNTLGITARENPADVGPDAPYFISTPRTIGLTLTYNFSQPR